MLSDKKKSKTLIDQFRFESVTFRRIRFVEFISSKKTSFRRINKYSIYVVV